MIGNIYFVDVFLGGEFSTYGIRVMSFLEADPENRIDPLAVVFPRVTKCSFYKVRFCSEPFLAVPNFGLLKIILRHGSRRLTNE